MTIGEFLRKNIKLDETKLTALKYQFDINKAEKGKINQELRNNNNFKSNFTTIAEVMGIVWVGTMFFGCGLGFFGFIPLETFGISMFAALGGGFILYKGLDEQITKKNNDKSSMLNFEKTSVSNKLKECEEKIEEMKKRIFESKETKKFFELCNRNDYLEKEFPIYEVQAIEYLKHDFSLISILYLANKGELPNKIFKDLREEEINSLKYKASEIDKQIKTNPSFFFEGESKVLPIKTDSRVRNYRSAKYREINNLPIEVEDKGRSR